jgi:hypothetical protein
MIFLVPDTPIETRDNDEEVINKKDLVYLF